MKRLVIALCAAGLAATFPALAQHDSRVHGQGNGGSQDMMQSMHQGMSDMQSMRMSGDPDKDFAQMMRMHHKHGVDMAEAELRSGNDPQMKEMARKIVEDQKKDIRKFDDWLSQKK